MLTCCSGWLTNQVSEPRKFMSEQSNNPPTVGAAAPGLTAPAGSRFWYVKVTSPGAEGTINLMFNEHPIQWINDPTLAKQMAEYLDSANA